ncbi:DUF2334 domain-containing protein [Corynebacterium vitaeruminis]|uniref:Deacetylase n=1 Tax=Corynebacterium vitaeruminis DSM 20294 TaxID=1224164 RepID=W5Y2U3_9CORY|nr:DUF2334 domain-containing protein [Corynebacterium vitaeruminis]AHI23566.1 hypothetical protein B843_10940 [Corynebacterium vitaeruminis DSM 20294]
MPRLLASISSVFDQSLSSTRKLVDALDAEGIPVSLLIAPRVGAHWHLAKDKRTLVWLQAQQAAGRCLILNGFDVTAQGRRAEFARLKQHEANLRLAGATRQMHRLGFDFDIFAPPRWELSPGTLEASKSYGFRVVASRQGMYYMDSGELLSCRNVSIGEGYGAKKWWRNFVIRTAERQAQESELVRLSVSARQLGDEAVRADFLRAVEQAVARGAQPADYALLL